MDYQVQLWQLGSNQSWFHLVMLQLALDSNQHTVSVAAITAGTVTFSPFSGWDLAV
jgi:hypothetical protein